jgi:outer membrane protein assembly factor BamB
MVREEGVYVASRDQSLYLVDLGFGQVRWRARFAGPLYEPPVVIGGIAYQHTPAEGLAAVDARVVGAPEERIRWRLAQGRTALTGHAGVVFVLTTAADLLAVDAKSGDVQTVVPAVGFTLGVPAPETAAVYLASPDGRVFCARVRGTTPPTAQDVLSAVRPAGATATVAGPGPTTRPAAQTDDPLSSKRRGPAVGGRSEVSRTYQPKAGEEQD